MGEIEALPGVEQPLAPGDVLLAVNGAEVASFEDLYRIAVEMAAARPDARCASTAAARRWS